MLTSRRTGLTAQSGCTHTYIVCRLLDNKSPSGLLPNNINTKYVELARTACMCSAEFRKFFNEQSSKNNKGKQNLRNDLVKTLT